MIDMLLTIIPSVTRIILSAKVSNPDVQDRTTLKLTLQGAEKERENAYIQNPTPHQNETRPDQSRSCQIVDRIHQRKSTMMTRIDYPQSKMRMIASTLPSKISPYRPRPRVSPAIRLCALPRTRPPGNKRRVQPQLSTCLAPGI